MKINCDKCGKVIEQKAALVFSPPEKSDIVKGDAVTKFHVCGDCWILFYQWLEVENTTKAEVELHIMQLAAVSTASAQNTHTSVKDRIDKNNPYWTQAYGDVCVAIDREIAWRERAECAEAALRPLRKLMCVGIVEKGERH